MSAFENIFILLGRIAVSAFFLWSALEKVRHWHAAADYLRKKKVPQVNYVMPVAVALQVIGGLSLLLGFYSRLGSFLLLICMVPHVYFLHDFWNHQGESRMTEKLLFMKDVAIIGALLLLIAMGGGHIAV